MRAMIGAFAAAVMLSSMAMAGDRAEFASLRASVERAASEPDARLEVDVSDRTLRVYLHDELIDSFPVAVGAPEHPTPRGSFTIDRIIWNPGWVPPDEGWAEDEKARSPDDPENPMVGAKLFFEYPDYYIHGTRESGSLGEAASHGCIRMRPDEVIRLARLVQAEGGAERSEEWFARVAADDGTAHEVRLPTPIPLVVRD